MGARGPRPKGELGWYKSVADLMVNEFMNFTQAAMALGIKFETSQEERMHELNPAFRSLLAGMHMEFFIELGEQPGIGKEYVKGVCVTAIRKLAESNQWDKVPIPLKQLSDVLGLSKGVEDRPVLANLTQADIDKIRTELKAKEETDKKEPTVVVTGTKPN
jgi:hypothetical protein